MNDTLTLTIMANITANYGENFGGNASPVKQRGINGKTYGYRSKDSIKRFICEQSHLYDDLEVETSSEDKTDKNDENNTETTKNKVLQKVVSQTKNVSNCRALEGGYLNTKNGNLSKNSTFYVTDAVACEPGIENQFHANLGLMKHYQNSHPNTKMSGSNPFNTEFNKGIKKYSYTIHLNEVGKESNFMDDNGNIVECDNNEKAERVNAMLEAIRHLSMSVKGELDDCSPLFVAGGIGEPAGHYFHDVVNYKNGELVYDKNEVNDRLSDGNYHTAIVKKSCFNNDEQACADLNAVNVKKFFTDLENDVKEYYKE